MSPAITSFFEDLKQEDLALWYKGVFDDELTTSLIELSDFNVSEQELGKSKKRVSYLMAESFQNIVRHGFKSDDNSIEGTFGVCNRQGLFHIYSSNRITAEEADMIKEKLESVNSMDEEELKETYRSILVTGTLSEKGGAGLGLIEMVRKSERPLQYYINEHDGEIEFALQIDIEVSKGDQTEPLKIEEATSINQSLDDSGTIILFKGDFKEESTSHVLNVMLRNTDLGPNSTKTDKMIFHAGVEMLQNISRHGTEDDGIIEGVFELAQVDNTVRVTAQNLVSKSEKVEFEKMLQLINSKTKEELNTLYKEKLKESVLEDSKFAGVGLIDLGRCASDPIEYSFVDFEEHLLFTISVYFSKE